MRPCLPQNDPRPARRAAQLAHNMDRLTYDHDGPLALLTHLPWDERFDTIYKLKRAWTAIPFTFNMWAVQLAHWVSPRQTLAAYQRDFPLLPTPGVHDDWREDRVFAWQRVAGANPMDIRRLAADEVPAFTVPAAVCSDVAGSTMEALLAERRVYELDHTFLHALAQCLEQRGAGRYLAGTRTLYARVGRHLRPLGIQLRPQGAVFTPHDTAGDWLAAKIFAQVADTTAHEMVHHLARTHLVLEPVAMATWRRLADNHPLGVLLREHFEDTLAINNLGRATLINPGGFLDQLMPGWLDETLDIVRDAVGSFSFHEAQLHNDLDARDVRDPELDYPYRDDAVELHTILRRFVGAYVALYYPDRRAVAEDAELRRWLDELRTLGRLKGLPTELVSPEQIANLITQVVWLSGPQHGCVNYAQWEYIAFVPNMSFAAFVPPPTDKGTYVDEEDVVRILPNQDQTMKQMLLMRSLTGWQYTRLGRYRRAWRDPRVPPLVARLQDELSALDHRIDQRNRDRLRPYPWLKPVNLPNSTNT